MNSSALAVCVCRLASAVTSQASINDLDDFDLHTTFFVLRDLETHERERSPIVSDGSVEFYNLKPQHQYLSSMDSDTSESPWSYVIRSPAEDVAAEDSQNSAWDIRKVIRGQPLSMVGARVEHPINIKGYSRKDLVEERPQFGIFKFFFQPSVMLSVGALVLVTYLPKSLKNLDPEVLEELQKNQIGARSS